MKIRYNEANKTVEIKDGLKTVYLYQRISAIFIIIASLLLGRSVLNSDMASWTVFLWGLCALGAIALLLYLSIKKTSAEELKISMISALYEDQFFGRKRLRIKLNNGKSRDLINMQKASDIINIKSFFKEIGIPIN